LATRPGRRWLGAVLAAAAGLSCTQPAVRPDPTRTAAPAQAAAQASEVTIALVGTSDVHGYVEPRAVTVKDRAGVERTVQRGGLPLLGGYLDNLRRKHPVLLLDGGDLFQGTMVSNLGEGQVVIDAFNALGYTAAAIGNHEFDYGPAGPQAVPKSPSDDPTGALKERLRAAKFPFLSVNVLDKATGQPARWQNLYPSRRVEIGGVPIGLVGAVTEDTPRTTNILNLRDVTIGPIAAAVRAEAEALRKSGVAAVVLTVHEGANCSSFDDPKNLAACDNQDGRVLKLVRELGGAVDAVVAGHSHAGIAHFVDGIPVIQAFAYGVAFARADLPFRKSGDLWVLDKERIHIHPPTELCGVKAPPRAAPPAPAADSTPGGGDATRTRPGTVMRCDAAGLAGQDLVPAQYEGQEVVPSAAVQAAIQPHVDRAAQKRQTPLGVTLPGKLRRAFRTESPLGLLLADLLRTGAARATSQPIDVAFQNGGGIRNELPAGPLAYGHLFEVLPFDNRLAVVTMTGAALTDLVRHNLLSSHGVLIPSGVTVEARCTGAGNKTLTVALADDRGKPIDDKKRYTVAVSDFLASGGDSFGAVVKSLPEGSVRFYDDINLRELAVEEITRYRGPLLSGGEVPSRMRLPGPRPLTCPSRATQDSAEP
jgi:5'-nucleotidase